MRRAAKSLVEPSDEVKQKGYIIWCYEGTIEKVIAASDCSEKKFTVQSKHAAAQILWDREFNDASGARVRFDFVLNPAKYAKDTAYLSSHNGWNLLSEEFVRWQQQQGAPAQAAAPSQQPLGVAVSS